MNKFTIILFLAVVLNISSCNSASILFYFGFSSYSHRLSVWPLVEALAERGHHVTFLSPFPPKFPNPKVTEFVPKPISELFQGVADGMLGRRLAGTHNGLWSEAPDLGYQICELLLMSSDTKAWLQKSKFDLVVVDALFNECGLGLAYVFKSKVVYFATSSPSIWLSDLLGHVPETSWIPDVRLSYQSRMTFLEKVVNTLCPLYYHFYVKGWTYLPKMEKLIRKELDQPDMPGLGELERNMSLYLVNSHYSMEYARSLPPAYVAVGGLQIQEGRAKPLPKEFEKFIADSGKNGVVYISFGSFAEVSTFPPQLLKTFYNALRSFPNIGFIWKSNVDRTSDTPSNVLTVKWTPQADLLAHKSVKAIITHGGLLSVQEATYFGIPLVVFPLFSDQDYNADIVERTGCGIRLEIVGITEEALADAIRSVLQNPGYKQKITEISQTFRDRPSSALDTAIWWTEYVLRYNETSFLKPLAIHQTWYEARLLDVWLFIVSIIVAVLLVMVKLTCFCISKLTSKNSPLTRPKKMKKN